MFHIRVSLKLHKCSIIPTNLLTNYDSGPGYETIASLSQRISVYLQLHPLFETLLIVYTVRRGIVWLSGLYRLCNAPFEN